MRLRGLTTMVRLVRGDFIPVGAGLAAGCALAAGAGVAGLAVRLIATVTFLAAGRRFFAVVARLTGLREAGLAGFTLGAIGIGVLAFARAGATGFFLMATVLVLAGLTRLAGFEVLTGFAASVIGSSATGATKTGAGALTALVPAAGLGAGFRVAATRRAGAGLAAVLPCFADALAAAEGLETAAIGGAIFNTATVFLERLAVPAFDVVTGAAWGLMAGTTFFTAVLAVFRLGFFSDFIGQVRRWLGCCPVNGHNSTLKTWQRPTEKSRCQ